MGTSGHFESTGECTQECTAPMLKAHQHVHAEAVSACHVPSTQRAGSQTLDASGVTVTHLDVLSKASRASSTCHLWQSRESCATSSCLASYSRHYCHALALEVTSAAQTQHANLTAQEVSSRYATKDRASIRLANSLTADFTAESITVYC